MLRLKQGVPITIDVLNQTKDPDLVHWHGLTTDPVNDGAMEEGSPMIAAGGHLRYNLTPEPTGTRWYHTHNTAGSNLSLGAYTGQFGFLLVDGKQDPARYDQEIFLAVHHWEPSFVPMVGMLQAESANHPKNPGSDVGYKSHHQRPPPRCGRTHPCEAGSESAYAPAERQRHRQRRDRSTRPYLYHHRHGRQPRPEPEAGSKSSRWQSPSASTPSSR